MKARDYFGLGVRLFGVWLICRAVQYIASFTDMKLYPASDRIRDGAAAHLIYAAVDFALAAFFLLGTRVVVAWSYGEDGEKIAREAAGGTGGSPTGVASA